MQYKNLNTFKITHEDGRAEFLNAENAEKAVANVDETLSPVVALLRTAKNVKTLVDELPRTVTFTSVISGAEVGLTPPSGNIGSLATPASGTIHVGDQITLQAIPAKNYEFVEWQMDGVKIGETSSMLFEIPELEEGAESVVFTAIVKLADIAWTSTIEPAEASSSGCVAFPASGTIEAHGNLGLIAVEADGYTFDHWERNGESIGTNKILDTTVSPLAEGEASCVYTAVFTAE